MMAAQAQADYEAALAKYRSDMREYEENLLPAYLAAQEEMANRDQNAGTPAEQAQAPAATLAGADQYEYEYEYDGEDEADSRAAAKPPKGKPQEEGGGGGAWSMIGELERAL